MAAVEGWGEVHDRFMAKVLIGDECWMWTAAKDRDGYGVFHFERHQQRANRMAWMLFIAPLSDRLQVLHTCDVSGCVRPSHLFLGTNLDNVADRQVKKRSPEGESHPARVRPERLRFKCKISESTVAEVRRRYIAGENQQQIADRFGISNQQVSNIVRGASRASSDRRVF